jgi:hypothetical protein
MLLLLEMYRWLAVEQQSPALVIRYRLIPPLTKAKLTAAQGNAQVVDF